MLQTLELLHYCRRFSEKLFAFVFADARDCEELLTDLRVLDAANIRQVLFCAADPALRRRLEMWNRSGHRFLVLEAGLADLQTAGFIGSVQRKLSEKHLPLITIKDFPTEEPERLKVYDAVMHCAVCLGAAKVFFPGSQPGIELGGRSRSYPTLEELEGALGTHASSNISREAIEFFVRQQKMHAVDMVIAPAKRGAIFREVFTHSGAGTLLTREYPNVLRPARESDVRDIMAIMLPYIESGLIRAVSEDALLKSIPSFTVYSVNDQIVAAASLIEHEDCYELAKLCTLPRYQARGRARDLVRALQQRARREGKRALFALTVQDFVGDFFVRLGFVAIAREQLPESWQEQYDFSRPSKAYWFDTL